MQKEFCMKKTNLFLALVTLVLAISALVLAGCPLGHTHDFQWEDTSTPTRWVVKPSNADKEIEQKEQVKKCRNDHTTIDTTVGENGYQWVDIVGTERDKQNEQTTSTLPNISGKNIDTLGRIGVYSTSGSSIGGLTDAKAMSIMKTGDDSLREQLYTQAQTLNAFFADALASSASGLSGGLATKFVALQDAEKTIGNAASTMTNGLTPYLGTVNTQRNAIITEIFGATNLGVNTERDTFNTYWDAYTKGNYLANADWDTGNRTVDGVDNTGISTATDRYVIARNLTGLSFADTSSSTQTYRGQLLGNIGDYDGQLAQIKTEMKAQIVEALGLDTLTGGQLANANAMADALIIQLGQDHEEFHAFVDDVVASNYTYAMGWSYSAGKTTLSSLGSQSSTRLASIDTTFDPEKLKGLSVSKATEMA
jgi:hypothetical protein